MSSGVFAPALTLLLALLPVALAMVAGLWLTRHLRAHATDRYNENPGLSPDEFAYLKGGTRAFVRYQLAQLTARGWLTRCDEEGAFSSSISPCYRAATTPPPPALLKGAKQELWLVLIERGLLTENMDLQELTQRLAPFGEAIHRKMSRHGLLLSHEAFMSYQRKVSLWQQGVLWLGVGICLLFWPTSHALAIFEATLTLLALTAMQPLKKLSAAWTPQGRAQIIEVEAWYEPMRRAPWRWKTISLRDRDFLLAIHSSR